MSSLAVVILCVSIVLLLVVLALLALYEIWRRLIMALFSPLFVLFAVAAAPLSRSGSKTPVPEQPRSPERPPLGPLALNPRNPPVISVIANERIIDLIPVAKMLIADVPSTRPEDDPLQAPIRLTCEPTLMRSSSDNFRVEGGSRELVRYIEQSDVLERLTASRVDTIDITPTGTRIEIRGPAYLTNEDEIMEALSLALEVQELVETWSAPG